MPPLPCECSRIQFSARRKAGCRTQFGVIRSTTLSKRSNNRKALRSGFPDLKWSTWRRFVGSDKNSSATPCSGVICTTGRLAKMISNGTMTQRDQYDTLLRLKNHHLGRYTISTGMAGTVRHGIWPKIAKVIRVNTFTASAPPFARTQFRVRAICGSLGKSPASFNAK